MLSSSLGHPPSAFTADKHCQFKMPSVHARHTTALLTLSTSKTGLPCLPPQIAAGLCNGLVALGEEPPEGTCPYCSAQLAKAQEKQIADKIHVICHRCKKVVVIKDVEKPPLKTETLIERTVVKQVAAEQELKKKPKKKRKKEINAGLTLPPTKKLAPIASVSSGGLLPKKSIHLPENSKSKNKLKYLMSNAEAPARGGLQDFLKKL